VIPDVPERWTFPAEPASVARARHAVAQALPLGCGPDLRDDLRLLASELVTNAVRHAPGPGDDQLVELLLWPADGCYWLAVSDAGSGVPVPKSPDPDDLGGRGLVLVDALATAWAVVPRRDCGKSVVAGVRRSCAEPLPRLSSR
jgi:anti-sigma regulatory factor (Ser/Thr protein kinase)